MPLSDSGSGPRMFMATRWSGTPGWWSCKGHEILVTSFGMHSCHRLDTNLQRFYIVLANRICFTLTFLWHPSVRLWDSCVVHPTKSVLVDQPLDRRVYRPGSAGCNVHSSSGEHAGVQPQNSWLLFCGRISVAMTTAFAGGSSNSSCQPHCSHGMWDRTSALLCLLPGRCSTVNRHSAFVSVLLANATTCAFPPVLWASTAPSPQLLASGSSLRAIREG